MCRSPQKIHMYFLIWTALSLAQIFIKAQHLPKSKEPQSDSSGKNYTQILELLKKTLSSLDPLSVWMLKDRYPTFAELRTNEINVTSCIDNQANLRLALVLLKVLKGEDINVVVYGGSNSVQGMFPVILKDWWNQVITPVSGSRLNLKSIAIGGTGSGFYQFCHEIYLVKNEIVDLFLLESAVNDAVSAVVVGTSGNVNRNAPLEYLTRQLLERPNNPAVFYVNMFLVAEDQRCLNLVDYGQRSISDLYAITTFNLRRLCCRLIKDKYFVDPVACNNQVQGWHSNLLGHAQVAFMLIHMVTQTLSKTTLDVDSSSTNDLSSLWFKAVGIKSLALPQPLYTKLHTTPPRCWAKLTPNYMTTTIRNSLDIRVVKVVGFEYMKEVLVGGVSYSAPKIKRTDAYGGFFGNKKASEVTVSFSIPSKSPDFIYSVGLVSRYSISNGIVEVWLDNQFDERVRLSLVNSMSQTVVGIVSSEVEAGNHSLTMRIVDEGNCVLVGVFVAPPHMSRFTGPTTTAILYHS